MVTWTQEEMNKLRDIRLSKPHLSWKEIGRYMGRSDSDCYQKYNRSLNPNYKNGKWTHNETRQLTTVVNAALKNGPILKWSDIAVEIPNKSYDATLKHSCSLVWVPKHCKERWFNHADPSLVSILKADFEDIERTFLEMEYLIIGNKWTKLTARLNEMIQNTPSNDWCALRTALQRTLNKFDVVPRRSVEDVEKYFKRDSDAFVKSKKRGRIPEMSSSNKKHKCDQLDNNISISKGDQAYQFKNDIPMTMTPDKQLADELSYDADNINWDCLDGFFCNSYELPSDFDPISMINLMYCKFLSPKLY
ncbi:hypothetical protein THRCLA_03933 [Thraustotheca clavata]|uniref:Myb-like domain-containing protein n=1 Tax=Thraustotheca clavata TaxID=74557 RepID=A0A1W0A0J2_9STRA|nr:hypothetical protein THRCLA_03933 [Thraustotheca clavata]